MRHLFLLVLLVEYTISIPFPAEPNGDTIFLQQGQTYEIGVPIMWKGLKKLVISGAGATLQINDSLIGEDVFSMEGETWIWEAVNIKGPASASLLNFKGPSGFLQIRGCYWSTQAHIDIKVVGKLSNLVLENNLFQTKGQNSTFVLSSQKVRKVTWKNNEWGGNYSFHEPLPAERADIERNRWPKTPIHASYLEAGGFYHPGDDVWCLPPDLHSGINDTYTACLDSWFVSAFEMQTKGELGAILYHPTDSVLEDQEIPTLWFFRGHHEIDFDGNLWEPSSLTVFVNSTAILSGLEAGWSHSRIQILAMQNATLELKELILTDKHVDIGALTSTSHVFFEFCKLHRVDMISAGLGHVHVQDSHMKEFVLSAPIVWSSGNVLEAGRIITQPYSGHMQYSQLKNTDYHISPFYLGSEPAYRVRFVRNQWKGESDLILSSSLSKTIEIHEDMIESTKLARKMAFSPRLSANNLKDAVSRPLFATPPVGHIWPSGSTPKKCPDGTFPGKPHLFLKKREQKVI